MRRALSIFAASTIIFLGLMVLGGCYFFVPRFNATIQGKDVSSEVGDSKSKRPLRVGIATRQQVEALLGPAAYRDESGHRLGYSWTVCNGTWIYPFCFQGFDQDGTRGLLLEFDQNDILKDFRVVSMDEKREGPQFIGPSMHYHKTRPPFDERMIPTTNPALIPEGI